MGVVTRLLIACSFVFVATANQESGGFAATFQELTLAGVTVDPAGGAIPGVSVELRQGTAAPRTTVTDRQGQWKFERVTPGAYEVRATLTGFRTTVANVQVGQPSQTPVRLVMQIGDLSETVIVSHPSPAIGPAKRIALGATVNDLPNTSAPPPPPGAAGGVVQHQFSREGLMPQPRIYPYPGDTASYSQIQENKFLPVTPEHALSTFSIDVDTASYSNVRRFLNEGRLPPVDAVRIEELINYFRFDYPEPRNGAPVSITTELGPAPWNPKHKLALVGLRAIPVRQERTPARNLTFLLDVSGSMAPPNRLPLIKTR